MALHRFNIPLILHFTFLFYHINRDKDNHTNTNLMKKEITTMKMKKFIAILAAAGMVASLAVGCGSSSDDTSASGDAAATEEGGDAAASEWDASSTITVVSREEGSGTRGAFTELFGVVDENDNDMTTLAEPVTKNTTAMMQTVSENANVIGSVYRGSLEYVLVNAVAHYGAVTLSEH